MHPDVTQTVTFYSTQPIPTESAPMQPPMVVTSTPTTMVGPQIYIEQPPHSTQPQLQPMAHGQPPLGLGQPPLGTEQPPLVPGQSPMAPGQHMPDQQQPAELAAIQAAQMQAQTQIGSPPGQHVGHNQPLVSGQSMVPGQPMAPGQSVPHGQQTIMLQHGMPPPTGTIINREALYVLNSK